MKKNILFIGYGDLGSRLASISKDDLVITGISRSLKPRIVPDQYHPLDWFNNSAQKVDLLENYDCLVITLTPTSFDEAGYEKGYEEGMKLISKLVKNISFKKDDTSQIFLDSETEVILKNIQDIDFQNHQKILVSLSVLQNGNKYNLYPSKNIYQPSGQVTNEVGTANNLLHQFYATISTIESDQVNLSIVFKPLINLLWISAIMLIFSIFLSVIKRK